MARSATRTHAPASIVLAVAALAAIVLAIRFVPDSPERETLQPVAPSAPARPAESNGLDFGEHGVADIVDREWAATISSASGIPERAVLAYAGAEIAFRQDVPECRVDWTTLAGIGFVESRHGQLYGGRIDESGQQTPPIFGIPLDGETTAEVPDTDGGALDGDAVWDRAVGPLQFIPSTWELLGADGNRDGTADPQNIDDAALAAARHLCRGGGDLSMSGDWIAAVGRYNRSVVYNNEVANATDRYRESISSL